MYLSYIFEIYSFTSSLSTSSSEKSLKVLLKNTRTTLDFCDIAYRARLKVFHMENLQLLIEQLSRARIEKNDIFRPSNLHNKFELLRQEKRFGQDLEHIAGMGRLHLYSFEIFNINFHLL